MKYLLNQNYIMKKSKFKYYMKGRAIFYKNLLFSKENKVKLQDYFNKNANIKLMCNKFYLKLKRQD